MGHEGGKRKAESRGGENKAKAQRVTASKGQCDDDKNVGRISSGGDDESTKRDKVHKIIADAIMTGEGTSRSLARNLAHEIEEALYSLHSGTGTEYASKAKSIKFNLTQNEELRDQVVSRELSAAELVTMDSTAMASSELQKRRIALAEESLKDQINTSEVQALREAAEGLSMKKTDQGLVVEVKEDQKSDAVEDANKTSDSEEDQEGAKETEPKGEVVEINNRADDTYTKNAFEWQPTGDEEMDTSKVLDLDDAALKISSPTLTPEHSPSHEAGQGSLALHADDDIDDDDKVLMPTGDTPGEGQLVWSGTMMSSKEGEPFDVDATLVNGRSQPDLMKNDLVLKGRTHARGVKDWLKTKVSDERKERSVFIFNPADSKSQDAYDALSNSLAMEKQVGVLVDNKYGVMYLIPPGDLSRLMAPDAHQNMIGVAITTKTSTSSKSQQELMAEVSSDLIAPSGGQEKIVKLNGGTFGKIKIETCRLRASLLSGKNHLDMVPKDWYVHSRAELVQVIAYLEGQDITVIDLEPDGEADTQAYLDVCNILQEKDRALVVLDTAVALMYIIPPVPDAGKLLNPPEDSPSNLIAVLILNKVEEQKPSTPNNTSNSAPSANNTTSTLSSGSISMIALPTGQQPIAATKLVDPRTSGAAAPQQEHKTTNGGPLAAHTSWGNSKLASERPPAFLVGQNHGGRGNAPDVPPVEARFEKQGSWRQLQAGPLEKQDSWRQLSAQVQDSWSQLVPNEPSTRPQYAPTAPLRTGRPLGPSSTPQERQGNQRGGGPPSPPGRGGHYGGRGWGGEDAAWRDSPRGGGRDGGFPSPRDVPPFSPYPTGAPPFMGGGFGAGPSFSQPGLGGPPSHQMQNPAGGWMGRAPPAGGMYGRQAGGGEGRGVEWGSRAPMRNQHYRG